MSIRRAEKTLTSLWVSAMDGLPLPTQATHGRNSPVCGLRDVESGISGAIGTPPRLGGPGWLVRGVVILLGCSLCVCAFLGIIMATSTPVFSDVGFVFANARRSEHKEVPGNTNGMVYNGVVQKSKPLPSILKRMTLLTRAPPPEHGPDLHSVGQAFPNWCEASCWESEFIWKHEEVQKDLIMAIVALVDRLSFSEKQHFKTELGAQNYPNGEYSDL